MTSDFSRRVYRSRRLVFALLAVVVANLALSLASSAEPESARLHAVSLTLIAVQLAGSLALLVNTRAWVSEGRRALRR